MVYITYNIIQISEMASFKFTRFIDFINRFLSRTFGFRFFSFSGTFFNIILLIIRYFIIFFIIIIFIFFKFIIIKINTKYILSFLKITKIYIFFKLKKNKKNIPVKCNSYYASLKIGFRFFFFSAIGLPSSSTIKSSASDSPSDPSSSYNSCSLGCDLSERLSSS